MRGPLGWMVGEVPLARVSGVVMRDGVGVEGAVVELHGWTTAAGAREVSRVVSGRGGRFDLGLGDPVPSVVVAREGEEEGRVWIDLVAGDREVVIELAPCARRVVGRLVDDARRPVAGVEVYSVVHVRELALVPVGRSDEDGRFSVCGGRTMAAGGGALGLVMLPPGMTDVGDVVLLPSFEMRGQVVGSDGRGVAGVMVWAMESGLPINVPWGQGASTDRDGRYAVRLGPGCYERMAVKRARGGGGRYAAEKVCGGPGEVVEAPAIELEPCPIAVTGVLWNGDRPAAGLVVRQEGAMAAVTDRLGQFSMPCAFDGVLRVDGHEVRPAMDLDGRSGDVHVEGQVVAGGRVRGVVTWNGRWVDGAHVTAEPAAVSTRTDGAGEYELFLPPGVHEIEAQQAGRRSAPRSVEVLPGSALVTVDVELDRTDFLSGVARQESRGPAAGVSLSLNPADGSDVARLLGKEWAVTRADGAFLFRGVSPGRYLLQVDGGPWRLAAGEAMEVEITPGREHEIELVLADRAGLAIRGRVVRADGRPARYARVSLGTHVGATVVDSDGRFSFEELAPGTYEVDARAVDGDWRCSWPEVAAGGPEVIFRVDPEGEDCRAGSL